MRQNIQNTIQGRAQKNDTIVEEQKPAKTVIPYHSRGRHISAEYRGCGVVSDIIPFSI